MMFTTSTKKYFHNKIIHKFFHQSFFIKFSKILHVCLFNYMHFHSYCIYIHACVLCDKLQYIRKIPEVPP